MKKVFYLLLVSLLISCSSTKLVDSWKDPEVKKFDPDKLLVVGMSNYIGARSLFEEELQKEFTSRGIYTTKSLDIFKPGFTHARQTEEDIDNVVSMLNEKGFDAVMVTAIRGVESKKVLRRDYYNMHIGARRFRSYYYIHQDIYFHPQYYDEYQVYHLETSLFQIKPDSKRTLVWIGYIDIVDPTAIESTVNDYVDEIIKALEKQHIIQEL